MPYHLDRLSLTTPVSWSLLLTVMAVPYVFSGVVVSLAILNAPGQILQA